MPTQRLQGQTFVYYALGRRSESDTALAEFIASRQTAGAFEIAEVYVFCGETDQAFEWLDRAYFQRDGGLTNRKDPRNSAHYRRLRSRAIGLSA